MESSMRCPQVSVPFPELEGDDVVTEFPSHPFPGGHVKNTMYIFLQFLQAAFIYDKAVKIQYHN